jgi:large subunit ribosomal protein L13
VYCLGIAAAAIEEAKSLGPDLWNKSYYPTGQDAANLYKKWYVVDATGQTLGRMAVIISDHIR